MKSIWVLYFQKSANTASLFKSFKHTELIL